MRNKKESEKRFTNISGHLRSHGAAISLFFMFLVLVWGLLAWPESFQNPSSNISSSQTDTFYGFPKLLANDDLNCEERCGKDDRKVLVCHFPPGNLDNPQTLCIAEAALDGHFEHHDEDVCGPCDLCPDDPNKVDPGQCGCGVPDTDSDGDGTADCNDNCPNDPARTDPGQCDCGVAVELDADSDGDGTADCNDGCPNDANKTEPGFCDCGNEDIELTDGSIVCELPIIPAGEPSGPPTGPAAVPFAASIGGCGSLLPGDASNRTAPLSLIFSLLSCALLLISIRFSKSRPSRVTHKKTAPH